MGLVSFENRQADPISTSWAFGAQAFRMDSVYLAGAQEMIWSAPLTTSSTPSSVSRSALKQPGKWRDTFWISSPARRSFLVSSWPISDDAPNRTILDGGAMSRNVE